MLFSQRLFLFLVFLALQLSVAASITDSLLRIAHGNNPKLKADAYMRLGFETRNLTQAMNYFDTSFVFVQRYPNDTVLCRYYGFRGLKLFETAKYKESLPLIRMGIVYGKKSKILSDQAKMELTLGIIFEKESQFDSSAYFINEAIRNYQVSHKKNNTPIKKQQSDLAYCYRQLGITHFRTGNYSLAIDNFYTALKYYNALNNQYGAALCYINLGNIYYFNKDYPRALEEYQKVLDISKQLKDESIALGVYTNLGSLYLSQQNYDKALYYFNYNLRVTNPKTTKPLSYAGIYNNIGLIYKHLANYDSALHYFNKALVIQKKQDYLMGMIQSNANIGITYIEMKQYSKAKTLLETTLVKAENAKMGETIKEIHHGLSVIHAALDEPVKALESFQKYVIFKDSINSVEVSKKINEYKEKYESEKKDREIEKLQQVTELEKLKNEKQVIINNRQRWTGIGLLITISALLVMVYFIRKTSKIKIKANLERMARNEEMARQKMLDLIKNQEVTSINSFMEGQDRERSRVASELHDRLGSLLSTVKLHFSSLEATVAKTDQERDNFSFALDLLDNSVSEVRNISHNLSKGVIVQFGLKGAIETLRDAINTAGRIKINFIFAGIPLNLSPDVEIELFRIVQELVTNAIKHSLATEIFVQMISDQEELTLMVEDHGVGFDMNSIGEKGLGLKNLQARVNQIGGEYHYETAPGKGVNVIITLVPKKPSNRS